MGRPRRLSQGGALVALLVVALALAAAAAYGWHALTRPLPLPRSPYDFDVRSGTSLASVARELTAAGVLAHPAWLTLYARVRHVDRTIKAGSYEIASGTTLEQLLGKLTQGDVTQTSLTIVEGTTFAQLKAALRADEGVERTVLDLPDAELLARLGVARPSAEGLFFPDTYFFARHTSDAAILKRSARMLEARLAAGWAARAPDLPLATPYDALILASIVEKETGHAADRPLVASVFVNRLKI
ncbi:MAG TPA: endolytic transglycosylase MltG, partial [Casimicrobiaceae bacterium]|nr:endolytic transglycosylase MltG [Casimicrobiaceae bacterium]